jgi:hypothetical protein
MMTGFAIGTDDHFGTQFITQFSPPHFKRAGRRELVIVEVRVNEQDFHADTGASNHNRDAAASRFWRPIQMDPP